MLTITRKVVKVKKLNYSLSFHSKVKKEHKNVDYNKKSCKSEKVKLQLKFPRQSQKRTQKC